MSNQTIHYASLIYANDVLTRQSELVSEFYVQTLCPVFNHKTNRVFIGHSSRDFSFKVDRTEDHNYLTCPEQELLEFDDEHLNSPNPVVQIKFPKFLFWTYEDDIWFEFNDHPMTSYTNNFIAIGGWFNLSNWARTNSLAITLVDETKPVIIKKGDPLFRMSFHSSNPDDGIILKKESDPEKVKEVFNKYSANKSDREWQSKIFSKTDSSSKCPVSFLFK